MSTWMLIWVIYKYGFLVFFGTTIFGIYSQLAEDLNFLIKVLLSLVFGLMVGLAWPIFLVGLLVTLQLEHGIFWRSSNWKSQSRLILEVLHHEGKEMRPLEIVKASKGRVKRFYLYSRLCRLEDQRLIASRLQNEKERRAQDALDNDEHGPGSIRLYRTLGSNLPEASTSMVETIRGMWNVVPKPA